MKKIFAILFSLQLIISPVALAQDQGVGLKDAYLETGTGGQGGYDFYVNQVLVLATSAIGSSIITQCLEGLKTPSIATYMAGSLVHIMSEIAGAKSKNDRHKKKMKDLEIEEEKLKKEGDVSQKAVLEQSLQEEKDTRDFLANRKNWMIAVTAIYTAAMGLALAEEFYGLASQVSTQTASCTAIQTPLASAKCTGVVLPPAVAACIAADLAIEIPACIANAQASSEGVKAATISHSKARSALLTACVGPYYASCKAAGEAQFALVFAACQPAPLDGGSSMLGWNTLLTMGYGFGMSKLGSGGGAISQYGSMLIGLLSMIVPSISKTVSSAYNFPIPRSITFGASAALTGTVTTGLAKREGIAEENVKKLEKVINEFKVQTNGETTGIDTDSLSYNDSNSDSNKDGNKKYDVKKLQEVKTSKSCFSKSGSQWSHSEKSCANTFKVPKSNLSNVSFPAIKNVSNLAGEMAQAVADGDNSKAGKIAGEIGAYAARVREETKKLQTAYNDMRKKEKKPTKDFDADVKNQVASLQAELNKAAASKNMNLANLGEPLPEEKKTDSDIKATKVSSDEGAGAAPAIDPMAGIGLSEEAPQDAAPLVEANPEQNLSDFETNEQDISKKNDVSLFKQLSNRYILNYTKIFERKKEPEVIQEPPKK
jgi:hypothetical protein